MSDPFDFRDFAIGYKSRYVLRDGAPPRSPSMPAQVEVSHLPHGQDRVEFFDVARPSEVYVLTKREFRETFDPLPT